MPININTQAIIAFKQLLGKSNTDVTKNVLNEANGISFNIYGQNIWIGSIDATPANAVADGVAVAVSCTMVLDGTSNGHALFATWPVTPPSGTDPVTSSAYSYGAGSLVGISAGDRVTDAISDEFGPLYTAQPKSGGLAIPIADQRDWIYQYNAGVFFQESGSAEAWGGSTFGHPDTIDLYVYIGNTVLDVTGGGFLKLIGTDPGEPMTGDIELAPDLRIYTTGSPLNPGIQWKVDHLLVENGVIKYDIDRSADYDNRTLVDKEYVDDMIGGTTLWELNGSDIQTLSSLSSPAVPNVIPAVSDMQDLGSISNRWKDLYLGTDIKIDINNSVTIFDVLLGDNLAYFGNGEFYMFTDGQGLAAESYITGNAVQITYSAPAHFMKDTAGNTKIEINPSYVRLASDDTSTLAQTHLSLNTLGIEMGFVSNFFVINNTSGETKINASSAAIVLASDDAFTLAKAYLNLNATNAILGTNGNVSMITATGTSLRALSSGYTGSENITAQGSVQTTDATVTTVYSIAMSNGDMITVDARVNGQQSAATEVCGAKLFAVFSMQGGVITQIGSTDLSVKSTTTSTVIIDTDASTIVRVRVTGVAATTMNWVGVIEYHKTITSS